MQSPWVAHGFIAPLRGSPNKPPALPEVINLFGICRTLQYIIGLLRPCSYGILNDNFALTGQKPNYLWQLRNLNFIPLSGQAATNYAAAWMPVSTRTSNVALLIFHSLQRAFQNKGFFFA